MLVFLQSSAAALDIQFLYHDDFASRAGAVAGLERAARMWEAVLDDPVTVMIDIREVPVHELGFTQAATYRTFTFAEYPALREALAGDATSDADAAAVAHLPLSPTMTFRAVDPQGRSVIYDGQANFNVYLDVPAANAKALGLPLDLAPDELNAEIQWNASMLDIGILDLDRSDGISGTDFVSVAAHEIGHALGFLSGTDYFDAGSLPNGPFAPEDQSEYAMLNVLDLFRYTAESLPHNDLAPGGDPYFSIDGGTTRLADFASGIYNGDGLQAGHWRGGTGLMDANLEDGVAYEFSALDLLAFDVIGWEVSPPLAGDYNASRTVEQADLDLVLLNWGADAGTPPGDWLFHLPAGRIDQAELEGVLLNWGKRGLLVTPAPRVPAVSVPEPVTPLLVTVAIAVAALHAYFTRRRRNRRIISAGVAFRRHSDRCPMRMAPLARRKDLPRSNPPLVFGNRRADRVRRIIRPATVHGRDNTMSPFDDQHDFALRADLSVLELIVSPITRRLRMA